MAATDRAEALAAELAAARARIAELERALEARETDGAGPEVERGSPLRNIFERNQADLALRESERRFQQLAEDSGTVAWEVDAEGLYTYVSSVSVALWGYAPSELVGRMHFYDLHPDEGREAFKEAALAAFARKESFKDFVNAVQTKEGRRRWVCTNGAAELNDDGTLRGYRGSDVDITVRMVAEAALRESNARLSAVVEASPTGIVVSRLLDGKVLEANDAAVRLYGFTREEALGRTVGELGTYVDLSQRDELVRQLTQHGSVEQFPIEFRRRSGEVGVLEMSGRVVELGGEKCLVSMLLDVTARKRAEESLRASEVQFRQLVDNITDVFWITSPDFAVMHYVSPGFEKIWGRSVESLYAEPHLWVDAILPAERERVFASFGALSTSDQEVEAEYRIVRPDGAVRWIRDRSFRVIDASGKVTRLAGLASDITANRQAEDEVRALSRVVEQSPLSIIITDRAGTIEYVNPYFERATGYTKGEVLGQNPRLLKSGTMPAKTYDEMWTAITAGGEWRGELCNRRKSGELFWESAVISGIRDGDGAIAHYIAVKEDVTERKLAEAERSNLEAQVQQAQRLESVGRLAGGVAHDFNNMLAVILSYAEMASEQVARGEPLHDDLQVIGDAARRSADLTRQLLLFSRQQPVAPRALDLNESIQGMLKMLHRLVGENVRLVWVPETKLWAVMIDPTQVDQILANLCVNARDAIADVGKLTVETSNVTLDEGYCASHAGVSPGAYVRLTVSDDGCGIGADDLAHVFEPFFTTKEVGKGTGLGLATVYGIVKQNDGHIDVSSEVGTGTTFAIYLPRHADPGELARAGERRSQVPCGDETILLVEDQPGILRATTRLLEGLGYTVLGATSPKDAVRQAQECARPIHLLLTDVIMPEMNGRDLAKHLTANQPGLRVVFMSGFTANVIAADGVLRDGVHFLQKPFSKSDLGFKVREALDATPEGGS